MGQFHMQAEDSSRAIWWIKFTCMHTAATGQRPHLRVLVKRVRIHAKDSSKSSTETAGHFWSVPASHNGGAVEPHLVGRAATHHMDACVPSAVTVSWHAIPRFSQFVMRAVLGCQVIGSGCSSERSSGSLFTHHSRMAQAQVSENFRLSNHPDFAIRHSFYTPSCTPSIKPR